MVGPLDHAHDRGDHREQGERDAPHRGGDRKRGAALGERRSRPSPGRRRRRRAAARRRARTCSRRRGSRPGSSYHGSSSEAITRATPASASSSPARSRRRLIGARPRGGSQLDLRHPCEQVGLVARRLQRVAQQHRDRHRTHAAGDRGDRGGLLGDGSDGRRRRPARSCCPPPRVRAGSCRRRSRRRRV